MSEYQFLIGVNLGALDNNSLNIPVLTPKDGIDIYFMNDYVVEPFLNRGGRSVVIDLEMKICLLNLTLLHTLSNDLNNDLSNSLNNLTINSSESSSLNNLTINSSESSSENYNEIENKSKCPFTIILNNCGLESPIIINKTIYNKETNNIKIYVHNLSSDEYVFTKNTSIFQLIMNDLKPVTMKIISIDDNIFT